MAIDMHRVCPLLQVFDMPTSVRSTATCSASRSSAHRRQSLPTTSAGAGSRQPMARNSCSTPHTTTASAPQFPTLLATPATATPASTSAARRRRRLPAPAHQGHRPRPTQSRALRDETALPPGPDGFAICFQWDAGPTPATAPSRSCIVALYSSSPLP